MLTEQRLKTLESWVEKFSEFSETVIEDSKNKQYMIDVLKDELFRLKAQVQVLTDELASYRR